MKCRRGHHSSVGCLNSAVERATVPLQNALTTMSARSARTRTPNLDRLGRPCHRDPCQSCTRSVSIRSPFCPVPLRCRGVSRRVPRRHSHCVAARECGRHPRSVARRPVATQSDPNPQRQNTDVERGGCFKLHTWWTWRRSSGDLEQQKREGTRVLGSGSSSSVRTTQAADETDPAEHCRST